MREYRRQPELVRAEIEAGLREYEDICHDILCERIAQTRIARCGTIASSHAEWFYRSLIYLVHGKLPDMAQITSFTQHSVMLH